MNTPLRNQASASRQRGFTLVELLAVLTIASLLLGAGIPALNGLIARTKLTSATNDLFASMIMARSEAAKRHARVAMCKSADGASCTAAGGWEQGWIVFHDTNNDGAHQAGEEIVWRAPALSKDVRLSGNLNVARYVSYAPTGETKLAGGAFQAGTITLCNQSLKREEARQIVISAAGRPRVQKTQVAECV